MPITAWNCPGCHGTDLPLDHFATSRCGITHVHPSFAASVLRHDRAHSRGKSRAVGLTQGLNCPRALGITTFENGSVDPLEYNMMTGGTAWHAEMESGAMWGMNQHPHMMGDRRVAVWVRGIIDEVAVNSRVDDLSRPLLNIGDWKTKDDSAIKYLGEPDPDVVCQISLEAELVRQTEGWMPTTGTAWYKMHAKGHRAVQIERLWTVEECLEHQPANGAIYTVRDLLHAASEIRGGEVSWADVHLYGETMSYGGHDKCAYCAVSGICKTKERGAAF